MTSRNFVFTCNNYTDDTERYIQCIRDVKFIGYAHEVGASGTKHLQGVICFENPNRESAVRKILPKCHIERMKGSFAQAWDKYIVANPEKPVDPDLYSYGVPPVAKGSNLVERWDGAFQSARDGDLDSIPSDLRVRYYGTWNTIAHEHAVVSDVEDVCGTWVVGPSGCGKSRYVRDTYGDSAYDKLPNKWWDGYRPDYHKIAFLDDLDPTHAWLSYNLNRWVDRYPFSAEVKGGVRKFRPLRIVVTSRYTIQEVFATADTSTRDSIVRRFTEVIDMRPKTVEFSAFTK